MRCAFCEIVGGRMPAAFAYRGNGISVFADSQPIRPGHVQIIPDAHFKSFEDLPEALASEIIHLGQRVARAQKRLFGVPRVGFVFSGHDVPHAHAHLIPLHDKTDLTSMRYFALGSNLPLREIHIDPNEMQETAFELREALECTASL